MLTTTAEAQRSSGAHRMVLLRPSLRPTGTSVRVGCLALSERGVSARGHRGLIIYKYGP